MATAIKLKSDIKKLKKAIETKGISDSIKSKLKVQLEKVENELAAMQKGAKPRKVSTTKGTTTALTALQKLIKRKKYSAYQGKGVDLKKDAGEAALPYGKRESKGLKANQFGDKGDNKGNVYYEYRPNRLDVKQPSKKAKYPKLEKGGVTETKANVIFKQYERNEDRNDHSENVVLLAKHFGSKEDLQLAQSIQKKHDSLGHMPPDLMKQRDELSDKLYPMLVAAKKKVNSVMAQGGQTDGKNGYVAFYKGKRIEVYADTKYEAQLKAAKIFNAKKSYDVNVALAEVDGKEHLNSTLFEKGGKIKDQYEGKSAGEIWDAMSKAQRQHFIYDHAEQIGDYRGKEKGELSSKEIIAAYNSEFDKLDKDIKNRFENHVREGQYEDGGMTADKKLEDGGVISKTHRIG